MTTTNTTDRPAGAGVPAPHRVVFAGERCDGDARVSMTLAGQPSQCLPLHLDVRKHSPCGFEWGYWGSGPAQLALALCVEIVGRERAERVYQAVKDDLIAPLREDAWMLSGTAVLAAVERAESALAKVMAR